MFCEFARECKDPAQNSGGCDIDGADDFGCGYVCEDDFGEEFKGENYANDKDI